MKTRINWRAKLEKDQPRKLVDDTKGRGKILIPEPMDMDNLIRKVPLGKLVTQEQLRNYLAREYGAQLTCPLCAGMFLRICAETAEEDLNHGVTKVTPYWRVVKADGSLNEKFPGGVNAQANRLKEEGYSIEPGPGKKPPRVQEFEHYLVEL